MASRAQAGLEYLVTYGWVLAIIVVVVGMLVFIFAGSPYDMSFSSSDPSSILVRGGTIVGGNAEIILQNITAGTISVTRVVFSGAFSGCKLNGQPFTAGEAITPPVRVSSGGMMHFEEIIYSGEENGAIAIDYTDAFGLQRTVSIAALMKGGKKDKCKDVNCDDGNPCTKDKCKDGVCQYENWKEGEECDAGKQCVDGNCVGANHLPIADAGPDQTVAVGEEVTLDGNASYDPDGNITAYEWKEGETVLSNEISFTKSDFSAGEHTITLTVTDNEDANGTDTVNIQVDPGVGCGEPVQITTNTAHQRNPGIFADKIIWLDERNGEYDMYMYDLLTEQETRITTGTTAEGYPDIYGDKIAWRDNRNGNDDIYMYNLSTGQETQITTSTAEQRGPDIFADKMVWIDNRNGDFDIYLYDISTGQETRITTAEDSQSAPAIYGDKIVWEDYRGGGNNELYMYDLGPDGVYGTADDGGEIRLTTDPASQKQPGIYGNKILWSDWRNMNWDVYMYDLGPDGIHGTADDGGESQISTNSKRQWFRGIYGDKIVWDDWRNGLTDVYMYDLSTGQETQITTDPSGQSWSVIYGNKIVWSDSRNGNLDIYMTTIC